MNSTSVLNRVRSQLVPIALCYALGSMALTAVAQTTSPLTHTTVDQLVSMLRISPGSKALNYQRTHSPDANHRCKPIAAGRLAGKNMIVDYDAGHSVSVNLAVQFADGSDQIVGSAQQLLGTLAQALGDDRLKQGRFAIAGHANKTGDEKVNREISCSRAIAVKNYLVSQGISSDKLDAFGFGSDSSLPGSNPKDDINRRVEIRRDVNSANQ